ncbi:MAG: penicillin-binding protein 1C [Cyclobacteriaceae bacterium]|nr:penicillin-binding protein 1C [Cyclobacteriaceae bacterium]
MVLLLWYFFSLPQKLFNSSYSTVLEDHSGHLLSAAIASDGQWRFPEIDTVNEKFQKAIIAYEDKRFMNHLGIDILALGRAIRMNIQAGHVVSGGSTLTMQTIRLSRKNPDRTVFQKIIEVILATRAELRYSKKEILQFYASHAPFGGNVVGIEAACWRYFGRSSAELSWGEAALLAVLPNNPSLIHLARNRDLLKAKRNHLLEKLFQQHELDEISFQLAITEPIPEKPQPLPRYASHLLDQVVKAGYRQKVVRSSVDQEIQIRAEQIVDDHFQRIQANQVFNAAALIVDVRSGEVLAYVGNTKSGDDHEQSVDVIQAPRSTGSILKPFLFAAMLDEGKMLPGTLIPDVPTLISGFAPKNFSRQYDGAVPADKALIRSLNVPTIYELKDYRYEKFYRLLQSIGMSTLKKSPDHYGLSLVLGGAEGSLWDITGMYASAARTLNNYFQYPGKDRYNRMDFHSPLFTRTNFPDTVLESSSYLSASSLWLTFETLKELYRPGEETGWQHFSSTTPIAWKTGTSFGFRDGWAVGVTPDYAVGVWVGNADGEGRPGLTGTEAAAPLMFDLFAILHGQTWFQKPQSELTSAAVCSMSGQRASSLCDKVDTVSIPVAGLTSALCQYHKLIHLSPDMKYRVHSECASVNEMKSVSWFVLPAIQEYYFKIGNLYYRSLPAYRNDCADPASIASMDIIYPKVNSKIYLPVQLDGKTSTTVFEATHRNSASVIFWHIDGHFLGSTQKSHRFSIGAKQGQHVLTLVDDLGETIQRSFTVISGD